MELQPPIQHGMGVEVVRPLCQVDMRYGHARAKMDCEFCPRRATIHSHFGETGEPIRCCAYCYYLMRSIPTGPWPRNWKPGRCNGVCEKNRNFISKSS
jgi:hypothetical protein